MDGIRAISILNKGTCRILSRRGLELTNQYPSLAMELPQLTTGDMILDGEIIALNELGRPSLQQLQQRMNLMRAADITRAEQSVPVYYFVFDIVYAKDSSLTGVKLCDRKRVLRSLMKESKTVRHLNYFEDDGTLAYEVCVENGFEGIVAKRLDSLYEAGRRSNDWLKVKAQQTDEFVIVGFSQGQGSRSPYFGSLLLGAYNEQNKLVYCGSVGTGFDERLLKIMCIKMEPLRTKDCPLVKKPDDEKKYANWLKPQLVAEIKFMDWTWDGHLRTPVFMRLRDDKGPEEVRLEKRAPKAVQIDAPDRSKMKLDETVSAAPPAKAVGSIEPKADSPAKTKNSPRVAVKSTDKSGPSKGKEAATSAPPTSVQERTRDLIQQSNNLADQLRGKEVSLELVVDGDAISFTHLDKIIFPGPPKITKREYLQYIAKIAPYLLPFLKDRPLSVVRSPDGVRGKAFYQKHWNFQVPDFVETCFLPPDNDEMILCNNLSSVIWFAQHGVMEYHVWPSRVVSDSDECDAIAECPHEYPDYMAFDLDLHFDDENKAKRAYRQDAFKRVCEVAYWLRESLQAVSLQPLLKVSGRNGLHVCVPLKRSLNFEMVRTLATTISQFLLVKHRDQVTIEPVAAKQEGKVLLDFSPNTRGKTLIAPYSARLIKEGTVSMPILWEELELIEPTQFTVLNAGSLIESNGDRWRDFFATKYDLETLLTRK